MYDQVCTVAWPDVKSELALKFAGTKNWFALDLKRFESFAERAGADPIRTTEVVQETLAQLVDVWNNSQVSTLMPALHSQHLQDFWKRVPLLRPYMFKINGSPAM
jgi:hypothetical protein